MEVRGKTIKELVRNLLKEMNDYAKGKGASEKFSTKFEIKGKTMKDCLQKFAEKILKYYSLKRTIFENLELEIVAGKKWTLSFSLEGKSFEQLEFQFKEISIEKLEEDKEGWRLSFSMK